MPNNAFIGDVARDYDKNTARAFAPETLDPAVTCLAELAKGGPVLEFAIGTGRVAIPLAHRGVKITGIELSADMLAELSQKPGARLIETVLGDMATMRVEGLFSLVYLVFNTITNLTTQEEQVACFENAARHLLPGGRFVIENQIPRIREFAPGTSTIPAIVKDDYLLIDAYTDTTHLQLSKSRHLRQTSDGNFAQNEAEFRYVWPSEMDLMARIAGLELEHRWADWDAGAYTSESPSAVSVWKKP